VSMDSPCPCNTEFEDCSTGCPWVSHRFLKGVYEAGFFGDLNGMLLGYLNGGLL
jgi:hypothetical protein